MMVCKMEMESKLDQVTTIVTAVFVAVYAAIAIRHVARYDLGFSFQEIRYVALTIATVTATFVAADLFGKKPDNAE
jgi:tetrahydromethanopterin S-methyltransferase subunit C